MSARHENGKGVREQFIHSLKSIPIIDNLGAVHVLYLIVL